MKVVEIFDSIQGEGRWMGVYCTFVRFAGCNLQCPFCDEKSKYEKAKEMTVAQIAKKCKQQHVILTGGEPTLQEELKELISKLLDEQHRIHIETNGTNGVPPMIDWVTCSPKAPEFKIECYYDELKLVVDEHLTLKKALQLAEAYKTGLVWLQPCDGPHLEDSKRRILKWIKEYPHLFRAGIQLHKYYWAR